MPFIKLFETVCKNIIFPTVTFSYKLHFVTSLLFLRAKISLIVLVVGEVKESSISAPGLSFLVFHSSRIRERRTVFQGEST